jgi:hypothetical protein
LPAAGMERFIRIENPAWFLPKTEVLRENTRMKALAFKAQRSVR